MISVQSKQVQSKKDLSQQNPYHYQLNKTQKNVAIKEKWALQAHFSESEKEKR